MTMQSSRLLHYKLFLALMLGVLIPAFAVMGFLRETTRVSLSDAFLEKAYLLENHIKQDVELAFEVGIPLTFDAVRGDLQTYFAHLLSSHKEVQFIALTDLDRNVIVFDGTDSAQLRNLLFEPQMAQAMKTAQNGLSDSRIARVGDFWVLPKRLEAQDGPFSWLLIAVDVRQADSYFVMQRPNFMAMLTVIVLLLWHFSAYMADKLFHEPKRVITNAQNYFVERDPVYVQNGPEGGEYGYLIHVQNSLLKRLSETYRQLVQDFNDVREAVFDDRIAKIAEHDQDKFQLELGYLDRPHSMDFPIGAYTDYRLPILALGFICVGLWTGLLNEGSHIVYENMGALIFMSPLIFLTAASLVREPTLKSVLLSTKFQIWGAGVFSCGAICAAAFDVFAAKSLLLGASACATFAMMVHLSFIHKKWWNG